MDYLESQYRTLTFDLISETTFYEVTKIEYVHVPHYLQLFYVKPDGSNQSIWKGPVSTENLRHFTIRWTEYQEIARQLKKAASK
jgi:hypothetical protein